MKQTSPSGYGMSAVDGADGCRL